MSSASTAAPQTQKPVPALSPAPPPKKVLARNIDEETASNYDLLITYASSISPDKLLTLDKWFRKGGPTGSYKGPAPTYSLVIDWTSCEDGGHVEVLNRAMERCFGTRGVSGWELFIRGDQLNLLMGTFRKEYLRLKGMGDPEVGILDLWVDGLLDEMKRIHALPSPNTDSHSLAPAVIESQHRRSSRSPSRPPDIDANLYPRTIPCEIIGKPPGSRLQSTSPRPPSMSPAASALASTTKPTAIEPSVNQPKANNPKTAAPRPKPITVDGDSTPATEPPASQPKANNPKAAAPRPKPITVDGDSRPVSKGSGVASAASSSSNAGRPLPVRRKPAGETQSGGLIGLQVPSSVRPPAQGKTTLPLALATESDQQSDESDGDPEADEEGRILRQQCVDFENSDVDDNEQTVENLETDESDHGGMIDVDVQDVDAEELDLEDAEDEPEDTDADGEGSADEDEEDEYQPTIEKTKRRKRVVDLANSDEEDDEPIFQKSQMGPARIRKAQAAAAQLAKKNKRVTGKTSTSKQPMKRRASHVQTSTAKRARLEQGRTSQVHTPESIRRSPQTIPGTQTGTEAATDCDTPTPSLKKKGKESEIWKYYVLITTVGKNKHMECRACKKPVKGQGTSNFHAHQRECPQLRKAVEQSIPGICCAVPAADQTTMERTTGKLRLPFKQDTFLAAVMKWIIVSGLPFTTIQNPHLLEAFKAANPDIRLQSARSLARKLEDCCDIVSERVIQEIGTRSGGATIHFSHDSWTDTGRKNCYFGVYVSYIDEQWEYREVLLRLLHMRGSHSGDRLGDGLFELFNNVLDVCAKLGPGTADNASNNRTAADRLAALLMSEYTYPANGADMVGCVCHIANLAALAYIGGESALTADDYAYASENIPGIRVMGENAFWNPEMNEEDEEEQEVVYDEPELRADQALEEENAWEDSELDEPAQSPLDKVHQLAVYVHSSPSRREEFERVRAAKNPETPSGLLPLKDIKTRWNSKEAAIARVIRLRHTVTAFTTRAPGTKCPRFTKQDFDALEIIQPTLKIFLNLTLVYSEVAPNSYRIIPDLINVVEELERLHNHPSVTAARKQSCAAAVKKLNKYLFRFLKNKWVCAALALDPTVREEGLERLLTQDYKADRYLQEAVGFIQDKMVFYQKMVRDYEGGEETVEVVKKKPERVNKFASSRYQTGHQEIRHDMTDPWACYNSDLIRFATMKDEPVLKYWKRMAVYKEMFPLALVARDVLGLASSSASGKTVLSCRSCVGQETRLVVSEVTSEAGNAKDVGDDGIFDSARPIVVSLYMWDVCSRGVWKYR